MLFMPVIDDLLKKDAFKQIVIDGQGKTKDSTTFLQALTPQKNVEKAIQFIKSKLGVGVVALDITGHSVFGSEGFRVARAFKNPFNDFKLQPTNLLFEGLEGDYSLNSMYDASNRIISEVQSQTMNSQVDAGKDPYAVLLGINNQTLGIMMYLVRRRVPVITVLKFLSQPLIQDYLIEQRKNESLINKQRGEEIDKQILVYRTYAKYGLKRKEFDRTISITDADLTARFKTMDDKQGHFFEYFLQLVDEVSAFNDLKNAISVDTKGKKDKAAVEAFEQLWVRVEATQIVSPETLNRIRQTSVLAPFFKAQSLYRRIYSPFYAVDNSVFGPLLHDLKDLYSSRQKGEYRKEKVRSLIDNDFVLFLLQNYNDDFTLEGFNELFGFSEEDSLAEQIKELSNNEVHSKNPVIRALFPLISIDRDADTNKRFDVIRLFERELSSIDLNDFIDAMKDIRDEISEDLYKKIIRLGINQAGFNNSPFSLNKIFPTFKSSVRKNGKLESFENDYFRELQLTIIPILNQISAEAPSIISQYEELFVRNNPDFAPNKYSDKSQIRFFYTYSAKNKKGHLFYKKDAYSQSVYPSILGGTYFKRYFIENALGLTNPPKIQTGKKEETVKLKSGPTFADLYTGNINTSNIEDIDYEDVTNDNLNKVIDGLISTINYEEISLGKSTVLNKDYLKKYNKVEDLINDIKDEILRLETSRENIYDEYLEAVDNNKQDPMALSGGTKKTLDQMKERVNRLTNYLNIIMTINNSGTGLLPSSLNDDTFTPDELNEAEQKEQECKGSNKRNIIK